MKFRGLILAVTIFFSNCNNNGKTKEQVEQAKQYLLDSVNDANRRQWIMDSLTAVSTNSPNELTPISPTLVSDESVKAKKNKVTRPQTNHPANTSADSKTNTVNESTLSANTGTNAPDQKKKKGLNNAAKGAIIGLGTGAAAGAVLNKDNRGKGAVIGGVVGAVGGAVGGAVLDKRKSKKEPEKDTLEKKEK